MNAGLARLAIPALAVVVFAAMLGWFAVTRMKPGVPEPQPSAGATTEPTRQAGEARPARADQAQLPGPGQAPQNAAPQGAAPSAPDAGRPAGDGPGRTAADAEAPATPSFDVVRVEPSGESVIAGRAAPGATVELLDNGTSLARTIADPSGLFAFVPPALRAGTHELLLQSVAPDGARLRSTQSVTVAMSEVPNTAPLVAVTTPGQPTVVLSRPADGGGAAQGSPRPVEARHEGPSRPEVSGAHSPEMPVAARSGPAASEPAAASPTAAKPADTRIVSVDAEGSGRLYVSGSAPPGATLRLYLNDTFVAPGSTGPDGQLSFTIEKGIRPGEYRVRLDEVDPVSGAVRSRAEVPFTVPDAAPVAQAASPPPRPSGSSAETRMAASGPSPESSTPAAPGVQPPSGPAPSGHTGLFPPPQPAAPASGSPKAAGANVPTARTASATVIVPEVPTAKVTRGDNLWRISKRTYGRGTRYTVIYDANQPQIRDPSLIYPGQIFVLPGGGTVQAR